MLSIDDFNRYQKLDCSKCNGKPIPSCLSSWFDDRNSHAKIEDILKCRKPTIRRGLKAYLSWSPTRRYVYCVLELNHEELGLQWRFRKRFTAEQASYARCEQVALSLYLKIKKPNEIMKAAEWKISDDRKKRGLASDTSFEYVDYPYPNLYTIDPEAITAYNLDKLLSLDMDKLRANVKLPADEIPTTFDGQTIPPVLRKWFDTKEKIRFWEEYADHKYCLSFPTQQQNGGLFELTVSIPTQKKGPISIGVVGNHDTVLAEMFALIKFLHPKIALPERRARVYEYERLNKEIKEKYGLTEPSLESYLLPANKQPKKKGKK